MTRQARHQRAIPALRQRHNFVDLDDFESYDFAVLFRPTRPGRSKLNRCAQPATKAYAIRLLHCTELARAVTTQHHHHVKQTPACLRVA